MKKSEKFDKKSVLKDIKDNIQIINCIDISDDFSYKNVFIYDCMIETSRIHCVISDNFGNRQYTDLSKFLLPERELESIIKDMVYNLETILKFKYCEDKIRLDYQIYTFFDYADSIKFILTVDFSQQDNRYMKIKKQNILNTQLKGKSKYLN